MLKEQKINVKKSIKKKYIALHSSVLINSPPDDKVDNQNYLLHNLVRKSYQARTGTTDSEEFQFPCSSDHEQDWQPYRLMPSLLYLMIIHTYNTYIQRTFPFQSKHATPHEYTDNRSHDRPGNSQLLRHRTSTSPLQGVVGLSDGRLFHVSSVCWRMDLGRTG